VIRLRRDSMISMIEFHLANVVAFSCDRPSPFAATPS
jgi:hypothetical protein